MVTRSTIVRALTSLVRSTTVAALLLQAGAVVVLGIGIDRGPVRWAGVGVRVWSLLSDWGVVLAMASLLACLVLAQPDESRHDALRLAALNVATLVLTWFVPAISAV